MHPPRGELVRLPSLTRENANIHTVSWMQACRRILSGQKGSSLSPARGTPSRPEPRLDQHWWPDTGPQTSPLVSPNTPVRSICHNRLHFPVLCFDVAKRLENKCGGLRRGCGLLQSGSGPLPGLLCRCGMRVFILLGSGWWRFHLKLEDHQCTFADTSPNSLDSQPKQSSFENGDCPCSAEAESKSGDVGGAARGGGAACLGGSSTASTASAETLTAR